MSAPVELRAARPAQAIIGVVGRDVPIELIEAHGAGVRRLERHPGADTAEAEAILGRGIDPAATAILAGILGGGAADLDAIVLCSDSDATQRLYYALRELARIEPDRGLPPLHLVDIMHLPRASSLAYSTREVATLADLLQSWTGASPSAVELAEAVRARDDVRRSLALLSGLRPAVSGSVFFALRARSDELPAAEASAEIRAVAAARSEQANARFRVALTGSSQYGAEVVEVMEQRGVVVVADDCPGGSLGLEITAREPSIDGIADRYGRDGLTPHRGSARERAAALTASAERSGARAIISYARRQDDAAVWDLAALRDAASVPIITLHDQDFGVVDEAHLRAELVRIGVHDD